MEEEEEQEEVPSVLLLGGAIVATSASHADETVARSRAVSPSRSLSVKESEPLTGTAGSGFADNFFCFLVKLVSLAAFSSAASASSRALHHCKPTNAAPTIPVAIAPPYKNARMATAPGEKGNSFPLVRSAIVGVGVLLRDRDEPPPPSSSSTAFRKPIRQPKIAPAKRTKSGKIGCGLP